MKISPSVIAPVISFLYRLWCATLRVREVNRAVADRLEAEGTPMMFCLWHDELFTLMDVRRSLKLVTMVSASRDGEYLARLLESLNIRTVRGSSSRGGVKALMQAARMMRKENYNAVITVDGPRGPRHEAKPGAVLLASRVPALLVPVRLFPRNAFVFRKAWDKFQLPKPFSRVDIVFGEPYAVPEHLEDGRAELEAEKLTALLNKMSCPADK